MFPEPCFVKMAFFLLYGEEKVSYYRVPTMYQVVIICFATWPTEVGRVWERPWDKPTPIWDRVG
jgi:hypothetical protein